MDVRTDSDAPGLETNRRQAEPLSSPEAAQSPAEGDANSATIPQSRHEELDHGCVGHGRPAVVQEASFVVIESGRIRFFVRPRVELEVARTIADVQRLVLTLSPRNQGQVRRVSVGKKRMPDDHRRERHWAYVDRVGSAAEVVSDLGPRRYTTKTRGVRAQAGLIEVASGTYAITLHRDHAHLMYELSTGEATGSAGLLRELGIAVRASYIAVVFNPESKWSARDRDEVDVPFSEPIADEVKERFTDKRRYAPLDPVFLEDEGTELLLIGGGHAEDAEDIAHASRTTPS